MEQAGFYVWRTTVEDNFGRKLTDEEWDIMARWITGDADIPVVRISVSCELIGCMGKVCTCTRHLPVHSHALTARCESVTQESYERCQRVPIVGHSDLDCRHPLEISRDLRNSCVSYVGR